jgi:hypothetical protein
MEAGYHCPSVDLVLQFGNENLPIRGKYALSPRNR